MYKFGAVQKKILLGLAGGVALGMSSSPKAYYRTLRMIRKDWTKINQQTFARSIKRLSEEKLFEEKRMTDGSLKLMLTVKGKRQAGILSLMSSSLNFKKSKHWDGKWRLVIFDIPEKDRIFRDILRSHLQELGFYKLQNSVFVSPHPFEKPILELVELYFATSYVRVITAIKIDNDDRIKKYFFKK